VLKDYCRNRLIAFEIPKRFYFVKNLPRTAKGTTDRRKLTEELPT
jgi:acyl-CoA synthetase (AMP-forming)/AMP-acid ligase II